ncbi:MAG: hypothetical protein Kow0067_02110 [Coriobacteriia bacterium]
MRLAVVQHCLRPTSDEDLRALRDAVASAARSGAEAVIVPDLPALRDHPDPAGWRPVEDAAGAARLIVAHVPPGQTHALIEQAGIGTVALVAGDGVIDPAEMGRVMAERPDVLILMPRSESDLQAEAFMELALGYSGSVAALVVVVEPDGAEVGAPGHGGSALIHLGAVVTEAHSGDDVLLAEVEMPPGPPEPRTALPDVPPILLQRLAVHAGRKLDVGYPADLD